MLKTNQIYLLTLLPMEELLKLLNQYEKEGRKSEYYEWEKWIWWPFLLFRRDTYDEEWSHLYSDTSDTYVISKKYWFIKWLVNNDKIDRPKVWLKIKDLWENYWWFAIYSWIHIECLLMLLSIQSEPIRFLISILK